MTTQLRAVDQLAMDEHVIQDPQLERVLGERERLRIAASEARRDYSEYDERAKGEIAKLELPAGHAVRVGPYRISRTNIPARSVAFETEATSRVTIARIEDEHA